MTTDGFGEWFPLPEEQKPDTEAVLAPPKRLDSLLPLDAETGAVCYEAFNVYLTAFIDLLGRHGQPLALLTISADRSETLQFLGESGVHLIAKAMARWLRQETRVHDVIGRAKSDGPLGTPMFLLACPLMTEPVAAQFAARLREAMTIAAADQGEPWLTLSIGIASLCLDTHSPDALILRAEEALASAQRSGGDKVWSHSDSVRRIIDRNRPDSLPE